MIIDIPDGVRLILNEMEKSKFECYAVGGAVRDSLEGKIPKDWDFTTNALPKEILKVFSGYHVFRLGEKFGTISVKIEDKIYEITTYRKDSDYTDFRHPGNVSFTSSLNEDLRRRDFTVNAMAYNDKDGLIDLYGGRSDLENKILRCVGDPGQRFSEDALRILRALRFTSVYKYKIENNTSAALFNQKSLLKCIAAERISAELNRILCGEHAAYILKDFQDIIEVIMPEIQPMIGLTQNNPHHDKDVWQHTVSAIYNIEPDPLLRITMLLHDIAKPERKTTDRHNIDHFKGHPEFSALTAEKILKRLKYPSKFIDTVLMLIKYHDIRMGGNSKQIKTILREIGPDCFGKLLKVQKADILAQSLNMREEKLARLDCTKKVFDSIVKEKQCFSLKDLDIKGSDLIDMGFTEGKEIGKILNYLLELTIDNKIQNDKQQLKQIISSLFTPV